MISIVIDGMRIDVSEYNMTIYSSHNVNKRRRMEYIVHEAILAALAKGVSYKIKRSIKSLVNEWSAHNVLYYLGIKRPQTMHTDLNDEPMIRRVGYWILSRFNVSSFSFHLHL